LLLEALLLVMLKSAQGQGNCEPQDPAKSPDPGEGP